MIEPERYAAIDIGSNSVRSIVVEGQKTILKRLVTTRLGDGLAWSGNLSVEAIIRTVEGVEKLLVECLRLSPRKIYAFATEAVRSAANGDRFLRILSDRTGIDAEVVGGDEEGELALLGALPDGDGGIIDIGGASAEISVAKRTSIVYSRSIPLGAVRLKDICGEDEARLDAEIDEKLNLYGKVPTARFYAVGGTATSVCSVCLGLKEYDENKTNGAVLDLSDVEEAYGKLKSLSVEDRAKVFAIDKKRAEIIVCGNYLLAKIMRRIGAKEIVVSEDDNLLGYLRKKVFGKSLSYAVDLKSDA